MKRRDFLKLLSALPFIHISEMERAEQLEVEDEQETNVIMVS